LTERPKFVLSCKKRVGIINSRPPIRRPASFTIMSDNKLLNFLKIVVLLGIFVLLLLRAFEATDVFYEVTELTAAVEHGEAENGFDPSFVMGLLADSGNLNPHGGLDDTLLKTRTILLTSDINANSTKQVVGSFILLNEQDAHTPIDLYVRTNGGYYDDAFAIIDVMRTIDAPVNTYAIGGCHSAGAIIVASGTGTRAAYAHALLMVHDNLSEDGSRYSNDTKENQRMHTFWRAFKQLPKTWFTKVTDEANYITAEEALEFGLVDTILRSE